MSELEKAVRTYVDSVRGLNHGGLIDEFKAMEKALPAQINWDTVKIGDEVRVDGVSSLYHFIKRVNPDEADLLSVGEVVERHPLEDLEVVGSDIMRLMKNKWPEDGKQPAWLHDGLIVLVMSDTPGDILWRTAFSHLVDWKIIRKKFAVIL